MRVALTFDDGPSRWTPKILDLLRGHSAKASFFVLGTYIYGNEWILKRIVDEGHTLGVHGWAHKRMSGLSDDEVVFELQHTALAMKHTIEFQPKYWRAPHFDRDQRVTGIADGLGLQHVGATVDSNDWSMTAPGPIVDRVKDMAYHGCIVDLHDGVPPNGGSGTTDRAPTVQALVTLLRESWDFVSLDELYA